jgi:hypothetical protein
VPDAELCVQAHKNIATDRDLQSGLLSSRILGKGLQTQATRRQRIRKAHTNTVSAPPGIIPKKLPPTEDRRRLLVHR